MPLSPGDRVGTYEILSLLGKGGMGEVYRARDPKLNRDVAIKVLPAVLANDADYIARFQREAQTLAALNHPNIATIYGLEANAIVMELVEGETLQGPLPLAEALPLARQIAEALDAAHDKGIIHRDLKPGNVRVTPEGVVKILDFGLAKSVSERPTVTGPDSPTLTLRATEAGLILGTAGYMSPEQAAGRSVDRRADIWAFGVVLYELLIGKRLFDGETVTHTLADVVKGEIDFSALPDGSIRDLVKRCLDRNLKNRLSHIGEARYVIDHYAEKPAPRKGGVSPWLIAIPTLAALALGVGAYRWRPAEPQRMRFTLSPPEEIKPSRINDAIISPDGKRIVYLLDRTGASASLAIRELDSLATRILPGTERANDVFWAPDSRRLGFFAAGKLKRTDIDGGAVTTVAETNAFRNGGAWGANDIVLFGNGKTLRKIVASGGPESTVPVAAPAGDDFRSFYPFFLPDGRRFLYTAEGKVYLSDVESGSSQLVLAAASNVAYAEPGYLLYAIDTKLFAVAFDASEGRVSGEPIVLAEGIGPKVPPFGGEFSTSTTGTLVHTVGHNRNFRQAKWFDRTGAETGKVGGLVNTAISGTISPDGKSVAIDRSDPASRESDIWLHDLDRGTLSRITFGPDARYQPVWSPDGSRIAYSGPTGQILLKASNGAGEEEQLGDDKPLKRVYDWSRDGRYLVGDSVAGGGAPRDIWKLALSGDRKLAPFLQTPFNEATPKISPDGRWIAYSSDETKRNEIYVQSFPEPGNKFQVSTAGGRFPLWSRDGSELFFLSRDSEIMVAKVTRGAKFIADVPKALFASPDPASVTSFDVSKDGRFLIAIREESAGIAPVHVVLNWAAGLKK